MSKWDENYKASRERLKSLENDIIDAGSSKFANGTSRDGNLRQTDIHIEVLGPTDYDDHSVWYNARTIEEDHLIK